MLENISHLALTLVIEDYEFFFSLIRKDVVCLEVVLLGLLDYAVVCFLAYREKDVLFFLVMFAFEFLFDPF